MTRENTGIHSLSSQNPKCHKHGQMSTSTLTASADSTGLTLEDLTQNTGVSTSAPQLTPSLLAPNQTQPSPRGSDWLPPWSVSSSPSTTPTLNPSAVRRDLTKASPAQASSVPSPRPSGMCTRLRFHFSQHHLLPSAPHLISQPLKHIFFTDFYPGPARENCEQLCPFHGSFCWKRNPGSGTA